MALAAVVLLLWCNGLDAPFHAEAAAASQHASGAIVTSVATPAPPAPPDPQLNCCFGATGRNLLSVTLNKIPTVAPPLAAGPPTVALTPAAQRPLRPDQQLLAPLRTSLVEQAVLIRI